MPKHEKYYLDREGFFGNNVDRFKAERASRYAQEQLPIFKDFPFLPFKSAQDFQKQLKAPFVIAIINAELMLNAALSAARNIALMLAHCVALDFSNADDFLFKAFIDIMQIVYSGFCFIVDVTFTSFALISQILFTAGGYIAEWAGYDAYIDGSDIDLIREEPVEGFGAGFLETSVGEIKDGLRNEDGLQDYVDSPHGLFSRFEGDFQTQFKACLLVPVSCAGAALGALLGAVKQTSLVAINLLVLDYELAYLDLKIAWHNTELSLYLALSAITDTLYAVTQLTTRMLTSIDAAAGECWDEYYSPSP